jgi:hypothetical protein
MLHPLIAFDEAHEHRIDQDAVRRAFARQSLGQRHAGRARHRGGCAGGPRRLGTDIEHIDDAPPSTLFHSRPRQPDQADRGEQLKIDILLPLRVGDAFEGVGVRGPGIVHQDVDAAEGVRHPRKGGLDIVSAPHVASDGEDLARPRPDRGGGLVQRSLPARQDRDIGAGLRKLPGNRSADAQAAAGDERCPAFECDLHWSFRW